VYFAPNTSEGFLHAVEKAIADEINRPSVLSISWGSPESGWTAEVMAKFDKAFQLAAERGITVVCAAGDGGVTDGVIDGKQHVDFPASSPWVLACGGTLLTVSKQGIRTEVVWNDGTSGTGGGVSSVFSLPEWQSQAGVPADQEGHRGRGIPDVAANASPQSGYSIYAHGNPVVIGGTAAATPLWAGLIAVLNQGLGRNVGHLNPALYSKLGPTDILHGITVGNNGVSGVEGYVAGPGWNACAGWGTPNGMKLLNALTTLTG
jgi:kumamolisin